MNNGRADKGDQPTHSPTHQQRRKSQPTRPTAKKVRPNTAARAPAIWCRLNASEMLALTNFKTCENLTSSIKLKQKIKVYYSPTNAQVIVLKNNIKIYIKIAPTCFGAVTPSAGSALYRVFNLKVDR